MTLLLPFTFGYEVAATLALLLGAHIGTIWGGSVTSILFNVPGQAKSLPLIFDGYPMTLKGEAERALGASAMATLLGGVIGAIFLALCIPIVRPLILALGPAEYLMMALWGMTLIATFSDGSLLKGLIAACAGVLIAFIGMDPVTATPRYTFGSIFLLDGVDFAIAMIGVFAVAEMMKLYLKGGSIVSRAAGCQRSTVIDGVRDTFRHWGLVIRSSVLGLWIGVLPGIGASAGGIAAYAQAVQISKHPETLRHRQCRGRDRARRDARRQRGRRPPADAGLRHPGRRQHGAPADRLHQHGHRARAADAERASRRRLHPGLDRRHREHR